MKSFSNLLISFIFAFLLFSFALFSIQNITLVSIKFFAFQSIQLSIGILLCLAFGVGLIFGNLLLNLFTSKKTNQKIPKSPSSPKFKRELQEEEEEEENDPLFDW